MKKYISILILALFIIPSLAFASWWNPFTWKIFKKREPAPQVQVINTEKEKTPEEKISELQKQLDELKNENKSVEAIKENSANKIEVQNKTTSHKRVIQSSDVNDLPRSIDNNKTFQNNIVDNLSVFDINVNATQNEAEITWKTTTPAESKIILNGNYYLSLSGVSVFHNVIINNLKPGVSYTATITALVNNSWVYKEFIFATQQKPVEPLTVYLNNNFGCSYNACTIEWSSNYESLSTITIRKVGSVNSGIVFDSENSNSFSHIKTLQGLLENSTYYFLIEVKTDREIKLLEGYFNTTIKPKHNLPCGKVCRVEA